MVTIDILKEVNTIHSIPKTIIVNCNIVLDCALYEALKNNNTNKHYKYDYDVYLPSFDVNLQRKYVWEHPQQNNFIISLLQEKPIESVVIVQHVKDYCNMDEIATNYVIDGKQRLLTIHKFLHNEFPIVINEKPVYYEDFDDELKRYLKSRVNSITAIVYYSDKIDCVTDDMKIKLFNYYNFAGTPQTEEHKNKLQSLLK